jgi:hypothetical protein
MSVLETPLPYVAPWKTGFTRYSTQTYVPTTLGTLSLYLTVPKPVWWRLLFFSFNLTAANAGSDRFVKLLIIKNGGPNTSGDQLIVPPAGSQKVNTSVNYLFAPTLTSVAFTSGAGEGAVISGVPDMLWQNGATFQIAVDNANAGDTVTGQLVGVEIYTEDYAGSGLAPAAAPVATPVLT